VCAAFEEEFKREINLLRRDPQAYARLIETERRPYYQDKIYAAPGISQAPVCVCVCVKWPTCFFGLAGVQRLLTREGLPACDEAIHFLMSVRSPTLFPVPRSVNRWDEQCKRSPVVRVMCFVCT
jgi:hypothetical protein